MIRLFAVVKIEQKIEDKLWEESLIVDHAQPASEIRMTENTVVALKKHDPSDRLIWATARPLNDNVASFQTATCKLFCLHLKHSYIGVINASAFGKVRVSDNRRRFKGAFLAGPETTTRRERRFV